MKANKGRGIVGLAAVALVGASFCASAITMSYEVGGGSVVANSSDPGLVVGTHVLSSVAGTSFDLDDDQSYTFGFFKIWTDESSVNADDMASQSITATLNFNAPAADVSVQGITFGGTAYFGLAQYGKVEWNGVEQVTVGDRIFEVSLSDELFNVGFFGLNQGRMSGAIVSATIKQISSTSETSPTDQGGGTRVPDGGLTVALLGLGLASVRGFRRAFKS